MPEPDTAGEPAPGKGWDFGDEEEEETPSFAEDLRAQALDIALVVAFNVLAFVSFFRKSKPLKYVTFVASVAYIGFYKSTLMSIVNVFGLFGGNLPILRYNLAWYLLAAITLVSTVLWGRVYCGRICAFGALTQLLDAVVPARLRINVPRVLERRASFIKFGILAFALSYFVITKDPLIYPYIEPFWMFGIYGRSAPMWIGLGMLLVATVFVRNLYCRFLCPLGRVPGTHLAPDRLPHQALVGVQSLPHLPEGLRVGGDPGAEDPADRMRALRRLRAAVRRQDEVPAPPDHHQEGRHPGPPRRPADTRHTRVSQPQTEPRSRPRLTVCRR